MTGTKIFILALSRRRVPILALEHAFLLQNVGAPLMLIFKSAFSIVFSSCISLTIETSRGKKPP